MNKEPDCITIKARDLVPYKHAVWCSVGGGKPFANTVYGVRWTDDGMISACLDTHNFLIEPPDADLNFIVERENLSEYEKKKIAEWAPPPPPSQDDLMVKAILKIAKSDESSTEKVAKIRALDTERAVVGALRVAYRTILEAEAGIDAPGDWTRNDIDPKREGIAWYRRWEADGSEPGDDDTEQTRVAWVRHDPEDMTTWCWEIEAPTLGVFGKQIAHGEGFELAYEAIMACDAAWERMRIQAF